MTSVDLSEFAAAAGKDGYPCRVATVLANLDSDHAARLRAALKAPEIQSAAIVRIVGKWDTVLPLTYNPVRRHRAGECSCE